MDSFCAVCENEVHFCSDVIIYWFGVFFPSLYSFILWQEPPLENVCATKFCCFMCTYLEKMGMVPLNLPLGWAVVLSKFKLWDLACAWLFAFCTLSTSDIPFKYRSGFAFHQRSHHWFGLWHDLKHSSFLPKDHQQWWLLSYSED